MNKYLATLLLLIFSAGHTDAAGRTAAGDNPDPTGDSGPQILKDRKNTVYFGTTVCIFEDWDYIMFAPIELGYRRKLDKHLSVGANLIVPSHPIHYNGRGGCDSPWGRNSVYITAKIWYDIRVAREKFHIRFGGGPGVTILGDRNYYETSRAQFHFMTELQFVGIIARKVEIKFAPLGFLPSRLILTAERTYFGNSVRAGGDFGHLSIGVRF